MLTRSRPCFILAALLGLTFLLTACAEVERTTVRRYSVSDGAGNRQPALLWESNRYPDFEARVSDECWDEARDGAPVPESCVSPVSTIFEANLYRTHQNVAFLGSLFVAAAIVGFALRRIAWRPTVLPQPPDVTPSTPATRDTPASEFADLMRVVDTEKGAQAVAVEAGYDLQHPGLTGVGVGVLMVVLLVLLLGYGAALGWSAVTAGLFLIGIGMVELVVLLPTRFQPADTSPPVSRMLFAGGVAVAFLGLAVLGATVRTPLMDLHGLEWLG